MDNESFIEAMTGARVFDLAQPYFQGMPHAPTHPPFLFSLTKLHGDFVGAGGQSSASDALALSGHTGTHLDALCHFSKGGAFHDGEPVAGAQSYAGIARHSIDQVQPILRRGVLLDLTILNGGQPLDESFEVLPEHLEAAERHAGTHMRAGDVAMLRTGWAVWWDEPARFVRQNRAPGPGSEGARWLSSRGVFAVGSDTLAFEKTPAPAMPAHVHLLVESGIHIMECLNLEALAEAKAYVSLFVAAPLKIKGGTASPIRPLALVR